MLEVLSVLLIAILLVLIFSVIGFIVNTLFSILRLIAITLIWAFTSLYRAILKK